MKSTSDVGVIIVNWNGKHFLEKCLPSIKTQTYGCSVVVVDNGSTDGSQRYVEEQFPEFTLIKLPSNAGFARPNNLGIIELLKNPEIQFIFTLNNDTELKPTCVEELVRCARSHQNVGAVQGKMLNAFERNQIDGSGMQIFWDMSALNRGHGETDHRQYDREEEIFGAVASASLYTRQALERVRDAQGQFFDEDYFAYHEDVDMAMRLRLLGFSSYYTPRSMLYHVHSGTGKQRSPFKSFYVHRNRYYCMIKDLPLLLLIPTLLLIPIRYMVLGTSLLRKKGAAADVSKKASGGGLIGIVLRAWKDVIRNFPRMWKKRGDIQEQRVVPLREVVSWFRHYRADIATIFYG